MLDVASFILTHNTGCARPVLAPVLLEYKVRAHRRIWFSGHTHTHTLTQSWPCTTIALGCHFNRQRALGLPAYLKVAPRGLP